MVIDNLLVTMTSIVTPLIEWVLSPIRELLVTCKACVPLLHPQIHHTTLAVDVVHRFFANLHDTFLANES